MNRIRIGISSCLLGQPVRYDRGHKRDGYITDTLGRYFEFVPVCPEVAIGMGVPRPPIRLVDTGGETRALGAGDPSLDVTAKLIRYGRRMARELDDLSGYIFKSRSPSCGMERVKLYGPKGAPSKKGVGLYAREIMQRQPLLPVEEEGRLNDPDLRENFIECVFAYHRWQTLTAGRLSPRKLVDFHAEHKLMLMAHDNEAYRALGRLVARAGTTPLRELAPAYIEGFII